MKTNIRITITESSGQVSHDHDHKSRFDVALRGYDVFAGHLYARPLANLAEEFHATCDHWEREEFNTAWRA